MRRVHFGVSKEPKGGGSMSTPNETGTLAAGQATETARGVVLVSKEHDVTEFASKDQTRYVINSVHYNKAAGCIEATNGRQLVRVPVERSEEFPPVTGADPGAELPDCTIPIVPFKKALAGIPNGNSLPIIQHAAVTPGPEGKVRLTTNDLDTEQSALVKLVEGNFPNTQQVIPEWPATLAIGLSPVELKKICDYCAKHGFEAGNSGPSIRFEFKDSLSPVRWACKLASGREATGVLMPMRLS